MTSSKAELQQMGFCTLCLYLKRRNTEHWCKDYFYRNKLYCEKCKVHVSMCTRPSNHEKTVLPDSVDETYDDEAEKEPPEPYGVVRAQFVTLEDYDHADYDDGYVENMDGYD